jgi:polysaccharide deacetylase 2 family uncharacterized protein YibQ
LAAAKESEQMQELAKNGGIDILAEYNILLPLNSMEEVKAFAESLNVNNLVDEKNHVRRRRAEIVSNFAFYFKCNNKGMHNWSSRLSKNRVFIKKIRRRL